MKKSELQKLIREIVRVELKALEKDFIVGVVSEVKGGLLKEIKAEMFDVLTSNRLPQPAPVVENAVIPTQPVQSRGELRALFEQANPMSEFNMGDPVSVARAPSVVKTVADLPTTAEVVTPDSVALYEKLLRGGK